MNAEFLKLECIIVRVEEGAGGSASLPNGSAGNEGLFIVMQLGFPCNTGVSKEDLFSASYQGLPERLSNNKHLRCLTDVPQVRT